VFWLLTSVFSDVVSYLLWRLHRPGGEDVDLHFVLPVWSVCVLCVCVLMTYRHYVCIGVRVRITEIENRN
jgi:hypothetical protein